MLHQLDFTPCAEEVLEQLENEAKQGKLAAARNRQEIAELKRGLENLKQYLGCGDRQREEIYWQQYRSADERLKELLNNPIKERIIADVDIKTVKQFLKNLPGKKPVVWKTIDHNLKGPQEESSQGLSAS